MSSRGRRGKLPVSEILKDDSLRARFVKRIAQILGQSNLVRKTTPVLASYVFEPEPVIRKPLYDYVNLFEVASTSWPLRRAFRAIIQECTRNRWKIERRFSHICVKCEKEYEEKPKEGKCTAEYGLEEKVVCGGELRTPSEDQFKKFKALLDKPNRDYHFDDFVRSSLFYDLSLDDWYWGIAYRRQPKQVKGEDGNMKILVSNGRPVMEREAAEVYIEDARFIFPIADQWGHLGGYQYFCPICYDKIPGDAPLQEVRPDTPEAQREKMLRCPECGGKMEQTAYVQEVMGQVVARWTKYEMIHGSSSRVLPALFGNSKILTVWKIVNTVLAMDDYNFEVYNEGKVGSIIYFPGYDQEEVDEVKTSIEEELQRLDKEDIQTGRYERSKKVRNMMLGVKKDSELGRIPVMNSPKDMQSFEFYQLYVNATAEVYGVTPTFERTTESGGITKVKIEVQNRTIAEHQANFMDLFNEEVLPLFGVTDWILAFNPVEARDELRLAQVHHTKAAAALTYLRGGFNVIIGPDDNLIVSGEGKIPEKPMGREGEPPRDMSGKPWREDAGEPTRTQGEQLELFAKALVKEILIKKASEPGAKMPISWYSATQIRISDRIYALNNDKNEVYVMVNGKEIEGTRTSAVNLNYAISNLLSYIFAYIGSKLEGREGFNIKDYEDRVNHIIVNMRRKFRPDLLINLANYFDSISIEVLAQKIDNLRMRLERIELEPLQVQGEPKEEIAVGEMLEPMEDKTLESDKDLQRKSMSIKARSPFGVDYEKGSTYDNFLKIIKWAKDQVKKGKSKKKVIKEAKIKAERTLEASYKELIDRAERAAKRRTRKKQVTISPEELRRIDDYKATSLEDFEKILIDSLGTKAKLKKKGLKKTINKVETDLEDIEGIAAQILEELERGDKESRRFKDLTQSNLGESSKPPIEDSTPKIDLDSLENLKQEEKMNRIKRYLTSLKPEERKKLLEELRKGKKK